METKIEPKVGLRERIINSINQEETYIARKYLYLSISMAVFSLAGMILFTRYVLQGFYESSFYSYVSLVFSDSDIIIQYWREFLLLATETLPLVYITFMFITILAFLLSLRIFAKNIKNSFIPIFNK
jgi:hypothetical protein